jgi:hypothetical protein
MIHLSPLPEWRPIPGFPKHAIRHDGVVIRIVAGRGRRAGWQLKAYPFRGYPRIAFGVDQKAVPVHRLVALAFLGPPPPGKPETAHWDGVRANNHVSNLRWASSADNGADKARHGSGHGERSSRARLTWEQVREIRRTYSGRYGEQSALARTYGVTPATMWHMLKGKTWRESRS